MVRFVSQDGTVCGTQNEFFGIEATARVEIRDATGKVIGRHFG